MKKIFLLLLSVSVFVSCQKKEYPTFNYPNAAVSTSQNQVKNTAPAEAATAVAIAPPATAAPQQQLSASANEKIAVVTEEEAALSAIPAEAITTKATAAEAKATAAKPAKLTWTQKIVAKKIEKQIKKANSPEAAKATKEKPDTVALLSLIFGGAGLLILLAGSGFGLLLGIAGLVMGIIGLGRVKKGQAPASSKTMALLGLIFGGVVTLIGLFAVALISSYGGFY